MAKKKKDSFESTFGKEIKKDLEKIVNDMLEVAKNIVEEYDISGDQISGSIGEIIQVHEDSPYLKEMFDSEQWKKVLNPNLSEKPEVNKEKDEKPKDDSK